MGFNVMSLIDKTTHAYMDGDSRIRDELVLKTVSIILSYVPHGSTEEAYHVKNLLLGNIDSLKKQIKYFS